MALPDLKDFVMVLLGDVVLLEAGSAIPADGLGGTSSNKPSRTM